MWRFSCLTHCSYNWHPAVCIIIYNSVRLSAMHTKFLVIGIIIAAVTAVDSVYLVYSVNLKRFSLWYFVWYVYKSEWIHCSRKVCTIQVWERDSSESKSTSSSLITEACNFQPLSSLPMSSRSFYGKATKLQKCKEPTIKFLNVSAAEVSSQKVTLSARHTTVEVYIQHLKLNVD